MTQIEINTKIAHDWIAAFNVHKVESILSLYAEDAIHFSPKLKQRLPETNGFVNGRKEMRAWWIDAFDSLPTLHYALQNLIVNDSSILMEYLRKVDNEEDMMVAEVLEIQNNLIVRSKVYHG